MVIQPSLLRMPRSRLGRNGRTCQVVGNGDEGATVTGYGENRECNDANKLVACGTDGKITVQ